MKILVLGSFGKGALENFFVDGFMQLDHQVHQLDINSAYNKELSKSLANRIINYVSPDLLLQSTNREVLKHMSGKAYDLILIFKGATLFPSTVYALKRHTNLLCNYNPDHPFVYFYRGSGNSNVKNSIPFYDIYFSYSESIVQKLRTIFRKEAFAVPFGYSHLHKGGLPTTSRPGYFLFAGAFDHDRLKKLGHLRASDLLIYGDDKWETETRSKPLVRASYQKKKLYGGELANSTASALAVINILREQNISENSHNMRTFEVPAAGGVLVSDYTDEQAAFFEPGKEALYYRNMGELTDILDRLRHDSNLIRLMKAAAIKRSTDGNYSYFDRAKLLLHIVQKHL